MISILITGGNGYIAKALQTALRDTYQVTTISRFDFDLTNSRQTNAWFTDKFFDVVIHTAIQGGSRLKNDGIGVLDANLKMYYNLTEQSSHYSKLINIGSGAELLYKDTPYGLSKHIIRTSLLEQCDFYNLRVFAVFDENELDTRFIKANITNYINRNPIVVHQHKYMDFFYMEDFVKVVRFYIENSNTPKEFDCCYTQSFQLSQIADKINNLSHHKVVINITNESITDNYVGTSTPIDVEFMGLDMGIKLVYEKLLCKK